MSGTVYDQALRKKVHEYMQDRAWADVLTSTLVKLNQGFWDEQYISYFFQNGGWANSAYNLEDAYCFAALHSQLGSGLIAACDVVIGNTPSADRYVGTNLQKLKNGLIDRVCTERGVVDPIFDVDLWCGTEDDDGQLSWSPYLQFQVFKDGQPDTAVWIPGRQVPLEVGIQAAAKTLVQINTFGALARWPYHSDTMRIFYKHKHGLNFPYQGGCF